MAKETGSKIEEAVLPVMSAGMASEQISYICEYCGKVNPIASAKCIRCGKRRPRSEYIRAMKSAQDATTIREKTAEQIAQAEIEQKKNDEKELVRLVEARVAEEKASLEAQKRIEHEQDLDAIQRLTARDAAMRVIEAEKRVDEVVAKQARENEETLRIEREKALYTAAKKLVTERQGIEQAAEERINQIQEDIEKQAGKTVRDAVDFAEKDAARRAVMKVIASEQTAEDRIRLAQEASQRAALEKIKEESERISQYEQAKYQAEKEGMQRAIEERIKAEREMLYNMSSTGSRQAKPYADTSVGQYAIPVAPEQSQMPVTIQPLAIVPYLNDKQPVYQYDPKKFTRQMYKFIPDPEPEPRYEEPIALPVQNKKCKKGKAVVLGILSLIASIAMLVVMYLFSPIKGKTSIDVVMGITDFSGGIKGLIVPALFVVIALFGLINIILSLVWCIRAKGVKAGWIVPMLAYLAVVGLFAVCNLLKIAGYVPLGTLIMLAIGTLSMVFAILYYVGKKRRDGK